MIGFYIRLGLLVAAALAGGGIAWRFVSLEKEVAYERAKDQVQDAERDAADAVGEARARVRACHDSGRVWDVSKGLCRDR